MRFLFDTDTLSHLYDPTSPSHPPIALRVAALTEADQIFLSILAIYELEYGYANAPATLKDAVRERIDEAVAHFALLGLSLEAARLFGGLKASLRSSRSLSERTGRVYNIDLMIAATAVTEGCTLVSGDRLYPELAGLLPELRVEDWGVSPL